MYNLHYFFEQDQNKVIAFLKNNFFAVVTGFGEQYPVATQLPLNIEIREGGKIFLTGHLMKNTDHHKSFEKNKNVLVVFTGPHCYVSASWYGTPAVASTWNYIAVHANGKIHFTDEAGTYQAIRTITDKYEGTETIAAFNNLPMEYVQKLIKAIVGFEIEVSTIDNVFKLSQNQNEQIRKSVITELMKRPDEGSKLIAAEMESRLTL